MSQLDPLFLTRLGIFYGLVFWVGGIAHLAFAAIPLLAKLDNPMDRTRLMGGMMKKYNPVAWTAIPILITSTTYLTLHSAGKTPLPQITLAILYTAALLDFLHSFILGPRAASGKKHARTLALAAARVETALALALPLLIAGLL
ncbi:MAG: hypothetical protein QXN23_05175 [Candidatus Caldarchaeum sp.]|uniref:TMEM205-like domain-containing protein n=1 Tax=Caldiarchaeum subterraneum TaxID=311458 RepID=A0A7C4I7Z8_CALS0